MRVVSGPAPRLLGTCLTRGLPLFTRLPLRGIFSETYETWRAQKELPRCAARKGGKKPNCQGMSPYPVVINGVIRRLQNSVYADLARSFLTFNLGLRPRL